MTQISNFKHVEMKINKIKSKSFLNNAKFLVQYDKIVFKYSPRK